GNSQRFASLVNVGNLNVHGDNFRGEESIESVKLRDRCWRGQCQIQSRQNSETGMDFRPSQPNLTIA
ncbi:MAG: hypothetical protein ABI273_18735, partial [Lacunisphaera sp.]